MGRWSDPAPVFRVNPRAQDTSGLLWEPRVSLEPSTRGFCSHGRARGCGCSPWWSRSHPGIAITPNDSVPFASGGVCLGFCAPAIQPCFRNSPKMGMPYGEDTG